MSKENNELAEVQRGTFSVTADTMVQLTQADIVDVVTVEFETQVQEQIDAGLALVARQSKALEKLRGEIRRLAETTISQLTKQWTDHWQKAFEAIGEKVEYTATSDGCNPDDGTLTLSLSHSVTSRKNSWSTTTHATWKSEHDLLVDPKVPEDTRAQLKVDLAQYQSLVEEYKESQQQLRDWRARLTKAADIARRTKAKLTTAALRQTDKGEALLSSMGLSVGNHLAGIKPFVPFAADEDAGNEEVGSG